MIVTRADKYGFRTENGRTLKKELMITLSPPIRRISRFIFRRIAFSMLSCTSAMQ